MAATFVLFQPLALGGGERLAVPVGGDWSILIVTEAEWDMPAPSPCALRQVVSESWLEPGQ